MPSLDNLLAATAAETKKTRPQEEPTISIDLNPHGDSANTVELKPDDLTGQLSRIEELLTGDAVKDILESIEELADITREHTDESAQPEVTAWLDDMQELIDDVKSDMRDFASLIRNEFIPAAAAMRGEVDSMNTAANKALDTSGALLPGESTGSAAFDTLNKMRTGQMDAQGYGQESTYDPAAQIQRAYATMAALPHAMDELVARDYATPRTQTTAGGYAPTYPISAPQPAQSQPMSVPSVGATHTSAGSISPMAQAAAATGAIAHGVARGLSGDTPQKRQQQHQQAAATTQASSGSPKPATSMPLKSGDKPAAPSKGGVSRSELNDMINNAKKRIAAERAGKRKNSPRQLPKRRPRPAPTLGGGNAGSKADNGAGKAKFLDIASTTPGVARADSDTTAEKPAAAAAGGGGNSGGGGGMRGGMGMMPMGGMMGAMNRAGNGPGGPGKGGEGSGSVEVPTDYNLDEVGKGATSAVAGGVVRPGMSTADEDDSAERIVSPIQRGSGEDDDDSKSEKRGLGNIFG